MVYFKMQDLIGRNCVEAYEAYVYYTDWLNSNICKENWHLDYSSMLLINGVNIPCGIKFYDYTDALYFVRTTVLY
jgi:hypothetical protein